MLRFATDEDFNSHIVNGVLRRLPALDVLGVREAGISGADDPVVLDWAAKEGRVLLTHDVNTMPNYAYERIEAGLPMYGLFEVSQAAPLGQVIDDLLLLATLCFEGEWENQILYVPLK